MVNSPLCLAGFGVERHELARGCCLYSLHEVGVVGQVGRRHRAAGIKAKFFAFLLIWRDWRQIGSANVKCGNVDKAGCWIEAHWMPVVRAKGRRVRQI